MTLLIHSLVMHDDASCEYQCEYLVSNYYPIVLRCLLHCGQVWLSSLWMSKIFLREALFSNWRVSTRRNLVLSGLILSLFLRRCYMTTVFLFLNVFNRSVMRKLEKFATPSYSLLRFHMQLRSSNSYLFLYQMLGIVLRKTYLSLLTSKIQGLLKNHLPRRPLRALRMKQWI